MGENILNLKNLLLAWWVVPWIFLTKLRFLICKRTCLKPGFQQSKSCWYLSIQTKPSNHIAVNISGTENNNNNNKINLKISMLTPQRREITHPWPLPSGPSEKIAYCLLQRCGFSLLIVFSLLLFSELIKVVDLTINLCGPIKMCITSP